MLQRPSAVLARGPQRASFAVHAAPNRVGFVGLGVMGTPMSLRLLDSGYDLVVYNRDGSKADALVEAGATRAASAREVAEKADITIAMLSDPEAALEVANGPDGVIAGLSEGKGYVDASTVDAATSRKIAAGVREVGGRYLEAPVSGSKGPAEQGALVFLTAGDEALFKDMAGPLDVMGKASLFLGEVGAGANMKLTVNMIMGTMMSSLAEGLSLAGESGLSEEQVVEVLGLGAMACPMFALKGPAMVERRFPTAFPLKHQQKDLRLAQELASESGVRTPVAAAANEAFDAALAKGHGDDDFSAVLATTLPDR